MLHLRKHLLPLLRVASHLPTSAASSSSLHLSRRRRRLLSTAATAATANPFSVEDYLVAACGLTGGQALKASKKLSHLNSPTKPDAVLAVISGVGLSRADLAAVVAADPMLLCARAHNVAHRLHSLRDRVGLSDADIARFLLAGGAYGLRKCDIAPRLEFWIGFVGSFDKLLPAVKLNNGFLVSDLDRVVKPNIALLQECGLSVCEIAKLTRLKWSVLSLSPERVKASVLCIEKLVVPRSSDRFKHHLLPLLRVASHLLTSAASSSSSSLHLSRRCLLSTAATAATANPFSVEDYLVAACGLTGGQALKASKKLSHLNSPTKPDAVLAVISGVGLSRADLAAVVAADPMLLCARAHNVAHRLHSLRDRVGLSDADIARFLLAGGAYGLRKCDIAPRLEFWIGFVGSFDKLLPAVKLNNGFLVSDLDRVVKPNIALLQECGLSVCEIAKLTRLKWSVLSLSPERVKASVLCIEKLVVPRSSDRFKHVLKSACWNSEDMLAMKMEFLRTTLGCSEDKLRAAVCMSPQILCLSNKILCQKIDFLISEVSLEREFIVERPWVLGYSLEKRMVPRHSVMKILRAMGLMKDAVDFSSSLPYSEKNFVARYIDPYKQAAPTLADSYTAACAGKMPAQVHL
uniref:Uncharacterized protein n=1 Tax=Oryza punctata TaxID=4537 RepID=A0A0E0MDT7_ORYPU